MLRSHDVGRRDARTDAMTLTHDAGVRRNVLRLEFTLRLFHATHALGYGFLCADITKLMDEKFFKL